MEVVNALGRRKSAVARIFVSEGTGKISINKRDLAEYFPSSILQYVVKQPLNKLNVAEKYDIKVNLYGGGFTGQSQALRLAIANSNVLLNGVTLHNGTTRNSVEVSLSGQGAQVCLCGMAIVDKNEQVDNHTFIDHKVPDCTSNELYKYVVDDRAIGAFAGKVLVREGAQHTFSQQTNRNICATQDARMYTQPQLEIYADDVKCSHGATVGQLDENALFYMQQRGISLREARLMLMFAFVNEVIDQIRMDALKDRLHLLVEKRFRGELNKCRGCAICK